MGKNKDGKDWPKRRAKDKLRDECLVNLGLEVFRFSDLDVLKDVDDVLVVAKKTPTRG